jgi:hypothetical protein
MTRSMVILISMCLVTAFAGVGCDDEVATATAPASVDGLRYDMAVTSATGSLSEGNFRISFSGTNHEIVGDGTIPDSTGNFTYSAAGPIGEVIAHDIVLGNPTTITLGFATDTSGDFTLTAPGGTAAGGTQAGTFAAP